VILLVHVDTDPSKHQMEYYLEFIVLCFVELLARPIIDNSSAIYALFTAN